MTNGLLLLNYTAFTALGVIIGWYWRKSKQ